MIDDREPKQSHEGTRREVTPAAKRRYQPPQLTGYDSVEDLVDAGVVGVSGTVPSVTSKSA